jgi:16S rRNA C967 or C1407 C5-methylase (RsmB/RsmF family)/NOL1/NOP2/fmu family ribosome biogenesis protein
MALPASFLKSLEGITGFDRADFEHVHETGSQVTSLRINPGKWAFQGIDKITEGFRLHQAKDIEASPIPWCANGYYLSERPSFTFDPYLHGGAYYVQEASSMFIGYALEKACGDMKGLKALDLCAAPGGKTTLLASLHNISLLVSNELIRTRVPVLYENVVKWGAPNVFVSQQDPRDFQRLPGFFDILLIDAPCSGSGLFRRDPEAISEWSPQNVTLCSQRQQRILADALPSLKEGGLLIYSTCSYSLEEDEEILDWLIKEQDVESVRIEVPANWNIVETISDSNGAYGYRFYPDKVKGEGFFMGCLRKKSGFSEGSFHSEKSEMANAADRKVLSEWVEDADNFAFILKNESYMAVPLNLLPDFNSINGNLSLRKSGTRIGNLIRGKLNPDHELAMSLIHNQQIPSLTIDFSEAIRYLRKETIVPETGIQGWVMMLYNNLPLGFLKSMPNRANNYYPSDWRIRSESPFKN